MRIPDLNVLLYASDSSAPGHDVAREWLEGALSGTETVALPLVVTLGYVRIATNPRIFESPLTAAEALDQVDEWLAQPPTTTLHPGRRHLPILRRQLETAGTAGNLTTDAHLAALAIEHRATLTSFDGDLHRFGELDFEHLRR